MPEADNHYRIVYLTRSGDRIVSMNHMTEERAHSLAALVNLHARMGVFRVEDEHEDMPEEPARAAA